MFPAIWVLLRVYAPYLTLPVAAIVGVVGYNIENIVSDKYTPYKPSIEEQREERRLKELTENQCATVDSLADKKFVPKSIFERNMSPQLVK